MIGLMLALELRRHDASVLLLERGEPGREASWAAGGMLAHCDPHLDPRLRKLATASAQMYGDLAAGLLSATGVDVDLRSHGAILLHREPGAAPIGEARAASLSEITALEPELSPSSMASGWSAQIAPEASVDPGVCCRRSAPRRRRTASAWFPGRQFRKWSPSPVALVVWQRKKDALLPRSW